MIFYNCKEIEKFKEDISLKNKRKEITHRSIEFAIDYLTFNKNIPAEIYSRLFTPIFGNQGRKGFSHWLKNKLFIEIESNYVPGYLSKDGSSICKKYIIDKEFLNELILLSGYVPIKQYVLDVLDNISLNKYIKQYENELNCLTPFYYKISPISGRSYHVLINQKVKLKEIIFKDWFNFDISNAAPTIMYQYYLKLCKENGIEIHRFNDLSEVIFYINNKEKIRKTLAEKHSIPIGKIKQILAALFNGSALIRNSHNKIYREILRRDEFKMLALQEDKYLIKLIKQIRRMWASIKIMKWKELRNKRKEKKWNIYTQEESKVRAVISDYLATITSRYNLGYFLEHDGGRIHKKYKLEKKLLEEEIYEKTGYSLEIIIK